MLLQKAGGLCGDKHPGVPARTWHWGLAPCFRVLLVLLGGREGEPSPGGSPAPWGEAACGYRHGQSWFNSLPVKNRVGQREIKVKHPPAFFPGSASPLPSQLLLLLFPGKQNGLGSWSGWVVTQGKAPGLPSLLCSESRGGKPHVWAESGCVGGARRAALMSPICVGSAGAQPRGGHRSLGCARLGLGSAKEAALSRNKRTWLPKRGI